MILPPSWATMLETLRPAFRRRATFALFCMLATGMVAQTSRRSVVGMLSGARLAGSVSFHAACRFFSHAFWTHDGSAQGGNKIARGNRWAVAGIVVRLPFCTAPVCLPVLFRLWAGKGTASSVELAGDLLALTRIRG
jgi:hypothetical protein